MRARGPLVMAVLCCIPAVLWVTAAPLEARLIDTPTALTSLGVVFGLLGVTAYALNIVLGARIKPVSYLFGGLDDMYAAHRANGRIAFVLVLIHGVLIIAGRATVSFTQVRTLFDTEVSWAAPLGVAALVLMSIAIGLTLYARLGHETFVYVQRSLGVIFVVASLHVFLTPGTKASSRPLTIYLAVVTGAALVAFAYRSIFGDVLVRRRNYEVSDVRPLDPHVVEITMTPKDRPLDFIPGQFVYVTFYSDTFNAQFHPFSVSPEGASAIVSVRPGDVRNQFHPFSITSGAGERTLRVAVKAVGDYTTAMRKLHAGAGARVEGPYGRFSYLNVDNDRQVWLAGGIGITPFLSMARSLPRDRYEINLFFGAKTLDSAYFLDELLMISETNPRVRVIPFPEDKLGLLSADYIEGTTTDLRARDILICGPPVMIDALTSQLAAKGIPRDRIHFERFGFGPT